MFFNGLASARQYARARPPGKCRLGEPDSCLAPSPGAPSRWHVSFTVADRDQTMADAERLGAQVLRQDDTEWTRTALIRDPQGAEFTASQFTPPSG
jgi:predicted enzyme related to lactoylglutathione lyase